MNIQIQIVTWNSAEVIASALKSIKQLETKPFRVLIIDNNSSDNTKNIVSQFNFVTIISLPRNMGFTGGHNIGFKTGLDCDGVLCVNPDVILFPDALKTIEEVYINQQKPATIGGKLFRASPLTKTQKISIVDTAGIKRHLSFQFSDIGASRPETNDLLIDREVFANSGACLFLPKDTIQEFAITVNDKEIEVFDNSYFAYKEDIDLGWRIHSMGKTNINTGKAIGTHIRKLKKEFLHSQRSKTHIRLSYRNHLLLLSKNLTKQDILCHGIFIGIYEVSKFIYLLITNPLTLITALKELNVIKKM